MLPGTYKTTTLMETVSNCSEVTLGCLSSTLNAPGVERHSSSGSAGVLLASGHQCAMWPKDFHACLWLFRSLCCNLLTTLSDTQSLVAIYIWTHPVWSLTIISSWMEDCLNTNSDWTRKRFGQFMGQTPVVNFVSKLLVRWQQVM